MKKIFKILGIILTVIVVGIGALLTYVKAALPNVGKAEEITLEYTPQRIERGKYLANAVCACMDCHSKRDWSKFSGPLENGTLGQGGERFDQSVGLPGVFLSRNITPEGITRYTDGELFRVITTGVNKEGDAMFPLMPYSHYGKMDREDIYSIIAYVRSLSPVKNEVPPSEPDFPMNFIIHTIPQKANFQIKPDTSDILAYGSYMVNASGCIECHTQVEKGIIIPELAFSGGREFLFPDGSVVRSTNITPDEETGIGKWTKEAFVQRFKLFKDSSYVLPSVNAGDFNSYMPWTMYAGMSKQDLGAIYTYLKSVKPISNIVVKFSEAKPK
ncbi:MAG: cytochrome C [Bacteroidetes bacterium]|nr:cytochrome C [Bacteroidota bacterium]